MKDHLKGSYPRGALCLFQGDNSPATRAMTTKASASQSHTSPRFWNTSGS